MEVVYDRLVYIDDEGLPQPWIAESWEISDDGKVITFKIREGIKFHDGTDVDANAVKFSYDRILDPEMAAPYKSFVETLESVDAPDATTAVFNFQRAVCAVLHQQHHHRHRFTGGGRAVWG